jgi:RHS repeat-associated protein
MGIPFSTTQTQLAQNKQKIKPLLFSNTSLSENDTFSHSLFSSPAFPAQPDLQSQTPMKLKNCALALLAGLVCALTGSLSAKDTWYVSDHLATTVASIDVAGEIAQMEADAFGTPLCHDGSAGNPERYTGKPYDEDLGAYVFPFRNYRAEEGRWMSGDPSGFPDGINGYLYTGDPLSTLDPDGLEIIHLNDKEGAASGGIAFGHAAAIVGRGVVWTYHSYASDGLTEMTFTSRDAALQYATNYGYDRYISYDDTTAAQEAAAREAAAQWNETKYNLANHNCLGMVNDMLSAAEVPHFTTGTPNENWRRNYRNNGHKGGVLE